MTQTNTTLTDASAQIAISLANYPANKEMFLKDGTLEKTIRRTSINQIQREKIKVCNRFTNAFKGTSFLDKSFPANGTITKGYNRATSVLLMRAVCGNYPCFKLAYPQVMVSKGRLPGAAYAAAVPQTDGNIYFSFTDNSSIGSASKYDTLMLVAWFEELQQAVFTLNGGLRADCEAVLETQHLKGMTAQTWIGFLSKDQRDASDSFYTGPVQL